ncbi:GAF domain-containing protein [Oscillatoria sp. FACHB-1407]|uniref:GAF domain-containing protein n=1 Tax=Oscillatoria sp. FACHB-1407 TaxID=2692847 RepID=UPI00168A2030|nr:GAF domain-containing protein [Oscillatoria sp. FACHB-1407]MBD2465982.1 GAF domain-containing protein [Oscillatoria sp. FACHB-1407]
MDTAPNKLHDRLAALEQENARLRSRLESCERSYTVSQAEVARYRQPKQDEREPVRQTEPDEWVSTCSSSLEHHLLETTAEVARVLLMLMPLNAAVNTALRMIGEALDTDRINVIENFDSFCDSPFPSWRALEYEWTSPGTVPQHSDGKAGQGSYEEIQWLYELFQQGQTASYIIDEAPEPFRSEQMAIGIKSTHLVPIFVEGQWWGVLGIDDCREVKQRSAAELTVLKIAADCIGSSIERDRAQQAVLQAEQERTHSATKHSQELERINTELQQILDRLAESEKRYRTLFELSSEGIVRWEYQQPIPITLSVDEQLELCYESIRIAEVNNALAQMYEYQNAEDLIGLTPKEFHDRNSDVTQAAMRAWIENGYTCQSLETEEIDSYGRKRYFLNSAVSTIENDCVTSTWISQVDITELRETQQALLQTEQGRVTELAKANEALARTSQRLSEQPDLSAFLSHVALEAIAQLDADAAMISMLDEQHQTLRAVAHVEQGRVASGLGAEMPINEAEFVNLLLETRKPRYFDLEREAHLFWPGAIAYHQQRHHQAVIAVPLFAGAEFLGHLGLAFTHTNPINEQSSELLYALAQQAALSIQLTRLAEEAKQAAIAREQEKAAQERAAELAKANEALARVSARLVDQPNLANFLEQVAIEAITQLGAAAGHLTVLDELCGVLRTVALVEPDGVVPVSPIAAEMPVQDAQCIQLLIETRRPRFFDLVEEAHLFWSGSIEYLRQRNCQAVLSVPLCAGGKFLGHLGLAFTRADRITEQGSELLQALAHQAALAIQLTQLAEEAKQAAIAREQEQAAQERAAELVKANEALKRSLDSLALEPSLDKFLGQVLTAISEQLQAPQVEYWYHPTKYCFHIGLIVQQGAIYSRSEIAQIYPDHPGIVGAPIPQEAQDQPIHQYREYFIRDNFDIPLFREHAERYALGLYQELTLPLILGEMNIGMLVIRLPRSYQLSNQQIELAQALAHQATLAVRLTQLTEEAKQAAIAREQEKAAQERAAELEKASIALQQTIDAVGQLEQLDALLPEVLRIVVAAFGARSCGYFEHPTDERIYLRYWFHEGTVYKPEQLLALSDRFILARFLAQGFTVPIEYLGTSHRHRDRAIVLDHLNGTCVPEFDAFAKQLGWGGELNVPLVCNGIALGALVIYRETPVFTQGEITLAESLGKQIALAMQTSQIAEREREIAIAREQQRAAQDRATELAKTNDALKHSLDRLAQESNLNSFLGHVLTEIANQVQATVGHIFLLNTETNELKLCLEIQDGQLYSQARPDEPVLFHSVFPMDITPVFEFLCQKRTLASLTAGEFEGMEWSGVLEWIEREGFTEAIGLALIVGEQPVGLLGLAFRNQSSLKPEEAELVQALAHQATLAIQMCYLAEQAKQTAVLEERNRMAREIHDTIAQGLAGILIQLQAAEDTDLTDAGDRQAHIAQARHLAAASLAEARRSVRALRPQVLEETNLAGALTGLMRDLTSNTSLQVTCRVQGTPYALPTEIETNLLRIAQEAINNTLKHAEATHIQIELSYQLDHVQLQIQDNGQGFDYDQIINLETSKKGYGLISMQERSQQISGNLTIASQPGEGTVLTIVVPLTL